MLVEVVVTRCNPVIYDVRVFKIVSSLSKKYSLLTLGWNRECLPKVITDRHVGNLKLCGLRAPHSRSARHSPKMVIYYFYYWVWLFIQLSKHRPAVVHACDLDTVIPCYFYKLLFRKKLIFDVFDRYAMAFVPQESKLFYSAVNSLEEFFGKRADFLITISEKVLNSFRRKSKHSAIIMNCPHDYAGEKKLSHDKPLKIVYTGDIVSRTRGLENIIAAIKEISEVEFIMAGWYTEVDKQFVEKIVEISNVKFLGTLTPDEALGLQASSDIIIGLYDPDLLWHSITIPNKVFDSMMCGVPLITNIATDLVRTIDFGIIVQYNSAIQIKEAILMLRDNADLRRKLGSNGRKAFVEKYNWEKMEEELFKIYEKLIGK